MAEAHSQRSSNTVSPLQEDIIPRLQLVFWYFLSFLGMGFDLLPGCVPWCFRFTWWFYWCILRAARPAAGHWWHLHSRWNLFWGLVPCRGKVVLRLFQMLLDRYYLLRLVDCWLRFKVWRYHMFACFTCVPLTYLRLKLRLEETGFSTWNPKAKTSDNRPLQGTCEAQIVHWVQQEIKSVCEGLLRGKKKLACSACSGYYALTWFSLSHQIK